MPTFSLKTLLVAVFVACFACLVLTNPSMLMAKVMMLIVVIGIVALTVVGFWLRRPLALVLVFMSIGYLVIADGGIFPSAERYLPTEWGLERCCDWHMAFDNGLRRSKSLTKWALAVNPNHKDWRYVTPTKPMTNTDKRALAKSDSDTNAVLDDLLDIVNSSPKAQTYPRLDLPIKLPVIAVTTVTSTSISRKRNLPQNRPHFIAGHCLNVAVLMAIAITYFIATSKRTSRVKTESNSPT